MGQLRVGDNSGDDDLFPMDDFQPIQASPRLFQLVEDLGQAARSPAQSLRVAAKLRGVERV
jgi:hypothetical protein